MTYALLIYRTAPPSVPIPELEERAALAGHRALQAEASARGELHAVARLDQTSTARTVRPRSGAHEVTDGPFIETKEWLVGLKRELLKLQLPGQFLFVLRIRFGVMSVLAQLGARANWYKLERHFAEPLPGA